jgi:protein phosphatase-4 regulatory subunit 3
MAWTWLSVFKNLRAAQLYGQYKIWYVRKEFMLTYLGLQEVREQHSAAAVGDWWTWYVEKFYFFSRSFIRPKTFTNTFSPDDALSDDIAIDPFNSPISLPVPALGSLPDIETQMRGLHNTQPGREALTKYVITEDYIQKLIPLVEMAEDMEDLASLHRLCNIMKTMILLNDTAIIELAVTDDLVLGVVGALEYDPDFPSHKANHRQWLGKEGRYKEVVRIDDEGIRKKIHATYRLQYLKDVVLARILDDPTFSVLNSLIFFNQVDIVQHLQTNPAFLKELFGIFGPQETDQERRKEAVLFIQQCCAIAKNLQQPARQQLYNNFLVHGLLSVINFALRHADVGVRVGANQRETDPFDGFSDRSPARRGRSRCQSTNC